MKITIRLFSAIGFLSILFLAASCSSYNVYRCHLFEGKNLLMEERYPEARDMLVKAAGEQNRAAPRAYACTVYYKLGDIAAARRYLEEAENAPGKDFVDLRITAYKCLILFKEGRQQEGMAALKAYLDFYDDVYPLVTVDDVRDMWKSGRKVWICPGWKSFLTSRRRHTTGIHTWPSQQPSAIITGAIPCPGRPGSCWIDMGAHGTPRRVTSS